MPHKKIDNWQHLPELKNLKNLPSPPKKIYYSGHFTKDLFKNCTAIVGSRRMTNYGRTVIEKIIPKLVFEKKTIISGFMTGCDQYAHEQTIENGGKTIAVLGWGINFPLEGYDKKLAKKIIGSGGLIISEWENQKPTLWTFPYRNRIVAALSDEVIIIEAAVKSGSLITANWAKKLKRKLWAIPGPITSKVSVGANALIAAGDAQMWLDENLIPKQDLSDPLLNLISSEPLTANELARKLNLPINELGAKLSLLTLEGNLIEKDSKYYLNSET